MGLSPQAQLEEPLMKTQHKGLKLRPQGTELLQSLRDFLTPDVWKQAHRARRSKKSPDRWSTQPMVLVLLLLTWCCGESQAERFEAGKAFASMALIKRRRPGQSIQGFQKALARLPLAVLRTVASGIRRRLATWLASDDKNFMVFGCDGSRLECPRSVELEQRLDRPTKEGAAPQLWV